MAAHMPVPRSSTGAPKREGGSSSPPLTLKSPAKACTIGSQPRPRRAGAACPGGQRAGAGVPEGPQGPEDQPGIDCVERRGAEPQLLDHAGPEILDEHVGLGQ